jgi:plastocyanin
VRITRKVTVLLTVLALCLSLAGAGCTHRVLNPGVAKIVAPLPLAISSTSISYQGAVVPPHPGEPPNQVWVDNYGVYPNVLTIKAGTTVTWANIEGGGEYLSVISDDGLFHGDIIASPMGFGVPGEQNFSYLFAYPGTFGYSIDPLNATDAGVVIVT